MDPRELLRALEDFRDGPVWKAMLEHFDSYLALRVGEMRNPKTTEAEWRFAQGAHEGATYGKMLIGTLIAECQRAVRTDTDNRSRS